jgi:hypothetical protein
MYTYVRMFKIPYCYLLARTVVYTVENRTVNECTMLISDVIFRFCLIFFQTLTMMVTSG